MTEQSFLPNAPLQGSGEPEDESDGPGVLPIVERDNEGRFEVGPVTTRFPTGLYVTDQFEDGENDPPRQVACHEVEFSATARTALDEGWELGWIQTVRPCRFWVVYRSPQGEDASVKLITSVEEAKRDGDYGEIWYESPCSLTPGEWAETEMGDDPNIGFWHPDYQGEEHPRLRGWIPRTCGGTKEFWTWLVAYKADGNELVFLHHIHWEVRFGGRLTSAPGIEPEEGTGAFLIEEGPGKGGQTPCYDKQEIEPSDDETQTLEDL